MKYFIEPNGDEDYFTVAKNINAVLVKQLMQGKWLKFPDAKVALENGVLLLTYNVQTIEQAEHFQGNPMNTLK